jgi:3-hydroxyisobutyrate dehydrogenase-like beta-hydroxyacid dehydrogenase
MARSKSKNVGIIGLGIIGSRVASALRTKGFQVFVWNRTPRPDQNFVGSPAEVAELCDVVQIFVSDDEALLEMTRQLTPTLTAQHVVTGHSTVAPESMRAAAQIVQRRGARFLDAPFTGSKLAAEKGQLVYYISGDEAALKQIRPILDGSSKEIVIISNRIGDASVMKVATNIVTAATAQVAAEALALVRKSGMDPEVFQRAMKHNASNSTTLEMKIPMMISGDFEPHFSVKHMLKDVRIGLKMAENHFLTLPVTDVSGDMLLAEMKKGRGDADYASIAQRYFPRGQPVFRPEPPQTVEPPKPEPPKAEPPKVELPKAEPPKVELPKSEATKMEAVSAANEAATTPGPASTTEPQRAEPATVKAKATEAAEREPLPGENLSGGIRGWLSRLGSSSRRAS